jgi:long-chain fatty acid transport protein
MKTKTLRLSAMILGAGLLLASSQARAAGFGINEHSAAVMGMAGAYTAVANSAAAGFWNPAGLATIKGFDIEAGFTYITPGASYQGIAPGTNTEVDVAADRLHHFVPNFHAAYRIHEYIAAGLSFTAPYGLTMQWPATVDVGGVETPWWGRGIVKSISLETVYINPNIAAKLHDRIYIGAGFVLVKGAVTLERQVTLSAVAADDIDVNLSGGALSFGATAGLLVKVLPDLLNVGVGYRSGVSMTFEGDAAFTKDGSPDAIPAGLRTRLIDGAVEAKLNLPHVISFGVAAFPMDPLTIGFSFDLITWSSYDKLAIDFVDNPELSSSEPKDWRNTICIRLGAEYRVLPKLPVRAGFIFDQGPPPAATIGPELPDGNRYEFTVGLGYEFMGIRADLAYQYLFTGTITPDASAPLTGTYGSDAHLAGLSLGYHLDI